MPWWCRRPGCGSVARVDREGFLVGCACFLEGSSHGGDDEDWRLIQVF